MKKLTLLLVFLYLLAGCAAQNGTTAPSTGPTTSSTESTPASSGTTTTEPTESTAPSPVTFLLYSPNEALDGFVHREMTVDSLLPEFIIQALAEDGVLNMEVQANSVTVEDGMLHLDLNEAFLMQIYSMGTTGEKMLMGSLVNTFLSAYGCESMMVTVDGEIIHSGHVDYDFPLYPYQ